MPLYQKKPVIIFSILILIVAALSIAIWKQSENTNSSGLSPSMSKPATSTSSTNAATIVAPYNELLETTENKTIRNTLCHFTFKIPKDWLVRSILGESKILSPEDESTNEKWLIENQEQNQTSDSGGPIGPDSRTLYISCQYNLEKEDLKSTILKTIQIDGYDAYEISSTDEFPDGTSITNYQIIVGGGKAMDIFLGKTEYDNLSDEVKQIIQSITFEE
ncbi:MAG: hypothetical protein P1P90_05810 [Patescibacteria group bacterium]|nr:hypothetical protein [Patescibacteria group bacterium]